MLDRIGERFQACNLELHRGKTHRKKGGGSDSIAAKVKRILDKIDDASDKR
nr:hypothetical protein [Methylocella tundrae]